MAKNPTLDEIIEQLDPSVINEKVQQPHAEARASHESKKIKVRDYKEFLDEVTKYVQHHHKKVYGADMDKERAYHLAHRILSSIRKEEGGFGSVGQAYNDSLNGKLQDVFNLIHKGMEGEQIEAYNLHVFSQVDPLDFDLAAGMAQQYMDKYASLLPPGVAKKLKKKKPQELANQWQELAKAHVNVVYGHRGVVKQYDTPSEKKAA